MSISFKIHRGVATRTKKGETVVSLKPGEWGLDSMGDLWFRANESTSDGHSLVLINQRGTLVAYEDAEASYVLRERLPNGTKVTLVVGGTSDDEDEDEGEDF